LTKKEAGKQAGYWKARQGAKVSIHPMRDRRSRQGAMIQIDGSPHDWFAGRSARCTECPVSGCTSK